MSARIELLFTERKRGIMLYLVEGMAYGDISWIFRRALGTVNTHVFRIYNKMRLDRREDLRTRLTISVRQEAKSKSQSIT